MRYGWEEFGHTVKHHRRYFFADHGGDTEDPDYIAPGALLEAIGDTLRSGGLIRVLPDEPIYRVRPHNSQKHPQTAAELGSPPAELAKSSRMSPAGVPLFYGALDPTTATTEAREANPDDEALTLGTFHPRHPARVVDLSTAPDVPSLYDPERRHLRYGLSFLRHFVEEISKPFVHDDRIHIEYVPTQVITKWLRTHFDPGPGEPVVGVMYGSSRNKGGVNVALFLDNDGACDPDDERDSALLVLEGYERLTK